MAGIAIIFPGQGTQESGMGLSLYKNSQAARTVFEKADMQRPMTSRQCFEGSSDELTQTANTQPCMWTVEMAAAMALSEAGIRADVTAGFSLGEIAALTYSGAVSFESGFEIVCKRALIMGEASTDTYTAMAAIMKISSDEVNRLCSNYENVWPVNYNCPGQVTISGFHNEIEDIIPKVKEAGGIAKILKVSGAFHSPLMKAAAEEFGSELGKYSITNSKIPLYSNYTGDVYGNNSVELLKKQICNPVHWQTILEKMAQRGIDTFIEAGPGKTLSGFIKRTLPEVRILSVSDDDTLRMTMEELKYAER